MFAARDASIHNPQWQSMLDDLRRYGRGAKLADCPALLEGMTNFDQAKRLVGTLAQNLANGLAEQPLGSVPLRHNLTDHGASLILASEGRAQLILAERAPGKVQLNGASFNGVERVDCILAGHARGLIVEQDEPGAVPKQSATSLQPGMVFQATKANERRTLLVEQIDQSLVTLRLVRHPNPATAMPAVEVSLQDGSIARRAAGTIGESRQELALTLLGAMGRDDAVSVALDMTREGPVNLRWQAVRQALTMDTAKGFRQLCAVASDPSDPLAAHAGALRDQLQTAHPVLKDLAA